MSEQLSGLERGCLYALCFFQVQRAPPAHLFCVCVCARTLQSSKRVKVGEYGTFRWMWRLRGSGPVRQDWVH